MPARKWAPPNSASTWRRLQVIRYAPIFDAWLTGKPSLESGQEKANFWSVDSFETEPQKTLIVYGTLADRDAQREAADLLQRKITRRGGNFTVPIKSDSDASDEDLKSHHLLLVGRPATNSVTARLADGLPVRFSPGSFIVRGETYAHPDSAVIAAGGNTLSDRFSVVVFAGLGAAPPGTRSKASRTAPATLAKCASCPRSSPLNLCASPPRRWRRRCRSELNWGRISSLKHHRNSSTTNNGRWSEATASSNTFALIVCHPWSARYST